jgi:hypothetical protein
MLKRRLAKIAERFRQDAAMCRRIADEPGDDVVSLMMTAYALAYEEAAQKVSRAIGQARRLKP